MHCLSCVYIHVSLDAASQVLEKHEEEFFDVVDAKLDLLRLKRKKVITESLISKIETANSKDAKEILFQHLQCNADVAALREYCTMIIAADAFPKLQKLGAKMLTELTSEGLLGRCGVLCFSTTTTSPFPSYRSWSAILAD